ncbi:MAG TPA: 2,3,4,5-tetrahydropyridine-2,6-dicarboxylate N-succinyltransferase, partial [Gammaproteobacteria bacterium]|nr:2,3,4,5-tetrahydropyridine-2,6-dicarboxylate N-succinyltransferase [Gammaproteobacteria bacterium]
MENLKQTINAAFDSRADFTPDNIPKDVQSAVDDCFGKLDRGELRVAEKINNEWTVNEWAKKAVLLSFRLNDNALMEGNYTNYYDKVPSKFAGLTENEFRQIGARVVPPAIVRRGFYIASGVVL